MPDTRRSVNSESNLFADPISEVCYRIGDESVFMTITVFRTLLRGLGADGRFTGTLQTVGWQDVASGAPNLVPPTWRYKLAPPRLSTSIIEHRIALIQSYCRNSPDFAHLIGGNVFVLVVLEPCLRPLFAVIAPLSEDRFHEKTERSQLI